MAEKARFDLGIGTYTYRGVTEDQMIDPGKDFKEHLWPYDLAHRGAGIAGMYYGIPYLSEFSAPNAFFTIKGEPYTITPESKFMWLRSRIVGGRTNHWARIALRFAEVDFKARSSDGMGDDWRSLIKTSLRIMTRWSPLSAFSGARKTFPARPTVYSFPRLRHAARN
jgi:choline dehydrogenase-like flavoprotein